MGMKARGRVDGTLFVCFFAWFMGKWKVMDSLR